MAAHPLSRAAGALPGAALAAAAGVTGALRRDKALHPQGRLGAGTLQITRPDPTLGPPVLAGVGDHPCELRWSRAMGLPTSWPDIEGLALRLPGLGVQGDADLLFASTGEHAWSRYLLTLRPPRVYGVLTTLLPVRAAGGPLTFRLVPGSGAGGEVPPASYDLEVARGAGSWHAVGRIDAEWSEVDTTERFDPVTHALAGTEQYPLVSAMREPAYVAARLAARLPRRSASRTAAGPT